MHKIYSTTKLKYKLETKTVPNTISEILAAVIRKPGSPLGVVRDYSLNLRSPWKCLAVTMTLLLDWLWLDSSWTSRGKRLFILCQFSDLSISPHLQAFCFSSSLKWAPWLRISKWRNTTLQKGAVILSFVLVMFFFLFLLFKKKTESLPKFGLFDVLWKEKQCYLSK